MKYMVRYGLTLALICVIAAGLLASVNAVTKSKILAQADIEEKASLKEVLPEAQNFLAVKKAGEVLYYKATDKDGKFMGVAFKAYGDGYSSDIETMVGMLKDGTISAIKILFQNETPGVGAQISEEKFTQQFKNKNTQSLFEVQAITGATISSTAVIDAVKERMKEILPLLKDEK